MDELRSRLVELTTRLIQINTVNPPGYTTEAVDFVRDWFSRLGFSGSVYEYVKGKPNFVVKAGKGKPILILNGHLDVVPPGDESRWSYPPFSGRVVGDRIYGRGATDMKGGVAVLMMVFASLASSVEKAGSGTLIFSATADEEVGGHAGVEALVKEGVLTGDAAIIAEPTGSDRVCIGEKGLCQVKLIARGRPAHGSLPVLGDNAIVKLMRATFKAEELISEFNRGISLPRDVEEAVANASEVYGSGPLSQATRVSLEEFRRVIGTVSFNPGVIRGGSKINMVPDYAELELDMRVPPGVSPSNVVDYLRMGLGDLVEVQVMDTSEPNYTPTSERIASLILDSISRLLSRKPKPIIMTGATDGRYLRYRGIPTVIYGPGDLTLAHVYDEYVTIDSLVDTYRVIEDVAKKYLGLT